MREQAVDPEGRPSKTDDNIPSLSKDLEVGKVDHLEVHSENTINKNGCWERWQRRE